MPWQHIRIVRFGGPETLEVAEEATVPEAGPNEGRIRVLAAGTGLLRREKCVSLLWRSLSWRSCQPHRPRTAGIRRHSLSIPFTRHRLSAVPTEWTTSNTTFSSSAYSPNR